MGVVCGGCCCSIELMTQGLGTGPLLPHERPVVVSSWA
jgi:hypothetical protein